MLAEFAYMVPLSSAVLSEGTIIRPAALGFFDLLSVQFSFQSTVATDSGQRAVLHPPCLRSFLRALSLSYAAVSLVSSLWALSTLSSVCISPWLCGSALCEPLLLHQAGYWPLCRMPGDEAAGDEPGTVPHVPQSENTVTARAPAPLSTGAAALLIAGDAELLRAVQRQHTEMIVIQQSVLRYTWSRAAAGARARPLLNHRAGNHLKGVNMRPLLSLCPI